jgi:hypothetical protein
LPGTGFEIGVSIKPSGGALDTTGLTTTYCYEDPTLPVPYDVVDERGFWWTPSESSPRLLTWKYDNPKNVAITGFQILLNGVPYNPGGVWSVLGPNARASEVRLPTGCAMHITWQVRAIAGEARSRPSALTTPENSYDLPTCPMPMYAMVKFNTIRFMHDCDDLDVYWFLRLNGLSKHFGGSCDPTVPWPRHCFPDSGWSHINDDCGPHSVASLAEGLRRMDDAHPDTVVADLGQTLAGGGSGPISIEIEDGFWNTLILTGSDDNLGTHRVVYNFASLEEAQQKLGCGREVCVGPGTGDPYAAEYDGYRASVCYTLYIFPQAEALNCPVKQPAYIP